MPTTAESHAETMANAHWSYVAHVLRTQDCYSERIIDMIGFHYKAAFIHGYKHGVEDAQEQSRC
jgi:hypothetical protein